jgi:hypothetical protein
MILGHMLSTPLILVAGVVYPAYATFKATQPEADAKETTRWLHYWMIFAAFSTVEWLLDLVGAWVPFYYELKLMFVLYLVTARFKGASAICTKYVEPVLSQHQSAIDEQLKSVSDKASNFTVDDVGKLVNWVTTKAEGYAGKKAASQPKPAAAAAAAAPAPAKPAAATTKPAAPASPVPDETHETVSGDDAVDVSSEDKKSI